ncbi:MAG: aminoacyl-tRNA hydrolase [Clostridia bacterium]|nr:aminoacyl-tRNA hydrolase [Clostridia bacterium]
MYLIVGLGNPEKKYEKTFHNMGYIAAGDVAELLGAKFKKKECEASIAEVFVGGEKVIIARPLTYMNNSGSAVKQLMAKYKIAEENLLVIYDDYDLPKGKIRIRASGSAGTHNGMRSIIGETGLKDFPRIRIGIRDEEVDIPIINYVLSEVRKEDYELFASACHKAGEAAASFASGTRLELVMGKYNG